MLVGQQDAVGVPLCGGYPLRRPAGASLSTSRRRASDPPAGKPRWPLRRLSSIQRQFSPGTPTTLPDFTDGQQPVRRQCSLAQRRIWRPVRRGMLVLLRWPRRWASSLPRESAPGRPRTPTRSASFTPHHVSPVASPTGPLFSLGHRPVRLWCAFAQRRTHDSVSRGDSCLCRWPRSAARRRARLEPPGNPRWPALSATSTAFQVRPGPLLTTPLFRSGRRPLRPRWAST
jgi:hypothetical protein